MKEVSRQLSGAIEIGTSSVIENDTRAFRKRSFLVQLSRAKAQVAFYEEKLRLKDAVEQLQIRDSAESEERRPVVEEELESVPESPDSPVLLKEEEGNARSIRGGRGSRWQR